MKVEQVAEIAHEANAALCRTHKDRSQPPWCDAPDWAKDSARNGVRFHLANPKAGPEASHNEWMLQKLDDGWTYGPTKDPQAKKHPCLVPFSDLPPEQQAKDHLFRNIVHALKPFING